MIIKEKSECTLLAVSPMASVDDSHAFDDPNKEVPNETSKFNAETHKKFFEDTFSQYYKKDLLTWNKASICDNTSTNLRIARLLGNPHVGCCNHKLNLDVELMVANSDDLKNCVSSVHNTMASAKMKLKNAALLRNLTELKPVLENKTRWSGKFLMFERFIKLRDCLVEIADSEDSDGLFLDRSNRFLGQCIKYKAMLNEINVVTKHLQTDCITLQECRFALDDLNTQITVNRTNPTSVFYSCTFTNRKSGPESALSPDRHFELGVAKIQGGDWKMLTALQRNACKSLLKTSVEAVAVAEYDSEDPTKPAATLSPVAMKDRLQRRLEQPDNSCGGCPYVNCDFIFGSSAKVERLWSRAVYILTNQRKRMTPMLFEALLFLQANRRFWDLNLVAQAIHKPGSDRQVERAAEEAAQEELDMALDVMDLFNN